MNSRLAHSAARDPFRIRASENLLPQPLQNQHLQKQASSQDARPEEHRDEGSLFAHSYRQPSNTSVQPLQNQHLQKCIKTKNFNPLWNQHLHKTGGRGLLRLTSHPARMLVLSESAVAEESRDLSSHPIRTCGERSRTMPVLGRRSASCPLPPLSPLLPSSSALFLTLLPQVLCLPLIRKSTGGGGLSELFHCLVASLLLCFPPSLCHSFSSLCV